MGLNIKNAMMVFLYQLGEEPKNKPYKLMLSKHGSKYNWFN